MAAPDEQILKLFVSSPGDVQGERERVDLVVELLNAEFRGRVQIKTIRWETSFYSSHDTFQRQIPESAECDAVIAIFGARLGSQLPPSFPAMSTGQSYPSGTAYEVLSALEARRKGQGFPDVYVFRRPRAPLVALDARDRADVEAQWGRLKQFFEEWFLTRNGEFLAAFQEFSSTDEFAGKIEACLRQWLARRGFSAQGAQWDRILLGSPFPGLSAFDEKRRSVFFGRELAIQQAIDRLRRVGEPDSENKRAPFLLILGASGSGKSSLLRAGLLPRLIQPGAVPLVDHWRGALMTPGADPFLSLAESLFAADALGAFLREGAFRTKELLARQLASDPEIAIAPLRDALDRAARARQSAAGFSEPRPVRLALAVDQAERLLLETPPPLAARFADLVAALARNGLAYVVMALRSDAYARFQSIEALVALRQAGATIDLLAPTAGELEEMVARPVAACDPPLAFEQANGRSLASQLVADARGGDALPLLQMTLARLYSAEAGRGDGLLRFADYQGMDEAVTQTANEALQKLDPAARAQLPALVTGLVRDVVADPVTGAPTPVIASLDRPAFEAGSSERAALVEAFVASRLLTTEGDAASQRVRPVHEALLRIWPQAVAIVAEAGNLIRVRHTLEPIVREWLESAPGDKARHLDISPALLGGAQRLVERLGPDLSPEMREFITQSSAVAEARAAHEREVQEQRLRDAQAIADANRRTARRTGIGLVAALGLAALAVWLWRSADAAKLEAQGQRARAENTLNLATKTADDLVFDLAQKSRCVLTMPKPVLKDILDRARALQEQLLNAGETSVKLKANHAAALGEIAMTQLSLGDLNGALDLARQAREIYAGVSAESPADVRYIVDLAFTDQKIGDILKQRNDLDGALAAYRRAQTTLASAFASGVKDARVLGTQSSTLESIGSVAMARGDFAGALKSFRDSLAIARTLVDADAKSIPLRNALAIVNREIGDALLKQRDIDGAALAFDAASVISGPMARENPDDTCLVRDYSLSEERLGETLTAKRDFAGALKAFEAGEAMALGMASKDPANLQWQYDIAIGYSEIAAAKKALGDNPGALKPYRDALAIDKALVAHDPDNALWRMHHWIDQSNLGNALLKEGDIAGAMEELRGALAFAASSAERDAKTWRSYVVNSNNNLGDALFAQGDYDAARKLFGEALEMARALMSADPDSEDAQSQLDASLTKVAAVLTTTRDDAGALRTYRESEAVQRKLIARDPKGVLRRGELAIVLVAIGHLSLKQGDADAAFAAFHESAALAKILTDEEPTSPLWPRERSTALEGVGDALRQKGDVQGEIDAYRESLAADQLLLRADPTDRALRGGDAIKQEWIGIALQGQKDISGAIEAFRAAAALRKGLADEAPPGDAQSRRMQIVDDNSVGAALAGERDFDGALVAYREGLGGARALDALAGAGAQAHFDLVVSLNYIGWMLTQKDDAAGAASSFLEALPIVEALAKTEPSNVAYQRELWLVGVNLGDVRLRLGDRGGALAIYLTARDAAAALVALQPVDASFAGLLKGSVDKIGYAANAMLNAGEYDAGLTALDSATPATAEQNWLDLVRAGCLMFLDRPDEARALYLKHRGEISYGGKPWETVAKDGIAYMRSHGATRPLMDEIEKTFATP